jgi:hypothetical protein
VKKINFSCLKNSALWYFVTAALEYNTVPDEDKLQTWLKKNQEKNKKIRCLGKCVAILICTHLESYTHKDYDTNTH